MHQIFYIDEILTVILSYICPLRPDEASEISIKYRRKTLARLARTCKTLSDPALDELWVYPKSFICLLHVLPTFIKLPDGITYGISSPVLLDHWSRLRLYASRIQCLNHNSSDEISPHVFEYLAKAQGDTVLLPNLRHIIWRSSRTTGPELSLLVAPGIKVANIRPYRYVGMIDSSEGAEDDQGVKNLELGAILESLSSTALTLEHLEIEGSLTSSSTSSIARSQQLRTLDISSCGSWSDPETFYGLASLKHLAELKINVSETLILHRVYPEPSFHSLQNLAISGTPFSLRSVFHSISSKQLHAIRVGGDYSYTPVEWQPCFDVLRSQFCNTLTSFQMNLVLGCLSMTRESEDIMDIVRPLLHIPILQMVSLDLEGHLRINDADVTAMAEAWGELRYLRVWCHKSGKGPSLDSLAVCAAKCPHLQQLALPVDASRPSAPNKHHSSQPSTSLDTLDPPPDVVSDAMRSLALLGNVGITDSEWVSSRIRSLFPHLRYFEAHAWDPSMAKMWDQVRRSIPHLRRRRRVRGH